VAAVQQSPVHADLVADDNAPVQAAGELGLDIGGIGRRGQRGSGQPGGHPGAAGNGPAGVDERGVGVGHVGSPGGDGDDGDFEDGLVVVVLSAAAFQVQGS
jgi:hypothetical protein